MAYAVANKANASTASTVLPSFFNCHYFDADMQDNEKLEILEQFETGFVKIVFATSAFGMGIDIPDIRVVVH